MAYEINNQMNMIKTSNKKKLKSYKTLHDLKTPLAGIRSYSEGLRDGVISDPQEVHEAYN